MVPDAGPRDAALARPSRVRAARELRSALAVGVPDHVHGVPAAREPDRRLGVRPGTLLLGLVIGAAGVGNTLGIVMASLARKINPSVTVVAALLAEIARDPRGGALLQVMPLVVLGLTAGSLSISRRCRSTPRSRPMCRRAAHASAFARGDTTLAVGVGGRRLRRDRHAAGPATIRPHGRSRGAGRWAAFVLLTGRARPLLRRHPRRTSPAAGQTRLIAVRDRAIQPPPRAALKAADRAGGTHEARSVSAFRAPSPSRQATATTAYLDCEAGSPSHGGEAARRGARGGEAPGRCRTVCDKRSGSTTARARPPALGAVWRPAGRYALRVPAVPVRLTDAVQQANQVLNDRDHLLGLLAPCLGLVAGHRDRRVQNPHLECLVTPPSLRDAELHARPGLQRDALGQRVGADVDIRAVGLGQEPEPLVRVVPLHLARRHDPSPSSLALGAGSRRSERAS